MRDTWATKLRHVAWASKVRVSVQVTPTVPRGAVGVSSAVIKHPARVRLHEAFGLDSESVFEETALSPEEIAAKMQKGR